MHVLGSSPNASPLPHWAQAASVSLLYKSRKMEVLSFIFLPFNIIIAFYIFLPVKPKSLIYPWVLEALEGKSLTYKLCSKYVKKCAKFDV